MRVTFLQKCRKSQYLTKLYGKTAAGKVVKISDYDAGMLFKFTETEVQNISEFRDVLIQHGNGDYIRIFGHVKPEYKNKGVIYRRNEYLTTPPEGVKLLYLDMDGKAGNWTSPSEFSIKDRKALVYNFKALLQNAGLGWLNNYDCVFMWSQSAWAAKTIRGHAYWMLDQGIDLVDLRNWGRAHNSLNPGFRLDTAVWRDVQPDYIGRRRVDEGLRDIFTTDAERFIFVPGDMMDDVVPAKKLLAHMEKDMNNPLLLHQETNVTLGATWQETLKNVGLPNPEGDINGWCYRAAAQAVQELGSRRVRKNLQSMAQQFHEAAWTAMARNTKGTRGDDNDRNTYDLARFRQYLKSAVDKGYGADKDQRIDIVEAAIKRAEDFGDIEGLFTRDVLSHLATIRNKWPAVWQEVCFKIKTNFRNRISIRDFRQAVDRASGKIGTRKPGEFSEGGGDDVSAKTQLMWKILNSFGWIQDPDGARYAIKKVPGGYKLYSLHQLPDVFYFMAQNVDPGVPQQFGVMCRSFVLGGLSLEETGEETFIEDEKPAPKFKRKFNIDHELFDLSKDLLRE